MSDTIQHEGKTYIEIGYLGIANNSAKRLRAELQTAREERDAAVRERRELLTALTDLQMAVSPSRVGVRENGYFVAVVNRMQQRELVIRPQATEAGTRCTRQSGHGGPCNGFPNESCLARIEAAPGTE